MNLKYGFLASLVLLTSFKTAAEPSALEQMNMANECLSLHLAGKINGTTRFFKNYATDIASSSQKLKCEEFSKAQESKPEFKKLLKDRNVERLSLWEALLSAPMQTALTTDQKRIVDAAQKMDQLMNQSSFSQRAIGLIERAIGCQFMLAAKDSSKAAGNTFYAKIKSVSVCDSLGTEIDVFTNNPKNKSDMSLFENDLLSYYKKLKPNKTYKFVFSLSDSKKPNSTIRSELTSNSSLDTGSSQKFRHIYTPSILYKIGLRENDEALAINDIRTNTRTELHTAIRSIESLKKCEILFKRGPDLILLIVQGPTGKPTLEDVALGKEDLENIQP